MIGVSAVKRIKHQALGNSEESDQVEPLTLPAGVKSLKQAQRLADVCDYLGFDTPEAALHCRREHVDLDELRRFYEAIKDEELCFTQGHQQAITALKQELRRAQQVKKKTEAQIAKSEKKLAAANAAITVLAKYLVTGKTGRDDDRR